MRLVWLLLLASCAPAQQPDAPLPATLDPTLEVAAKDPYQLARWINRHTDVEDAIDPLWPLIGIKPTTVLWNRPTGLRS